MEGADGLQGSRKSAARATANASTGAPQNALHKVFVRGAETDLPRQSAACATRVPASATGRAALAMHGSGRKAGRGAIPTRHTPPSASGPAARRRSAPHRVSAPGAARRRPRPAALPASRAWRRAAPPIGPAMRPVRTAGMLYGGANAEAKRRSARAQSRKRQKARREAGLCIRCGTHSPVEGGTTCAPCRDKRQAAERQQYEERRAAGLCARCGGPAFDGLSRCGPCTAIDEASRSPERKNDRSRRLYAERRARGLCTACGAPSQGAARCAPCAEQSYHRSDHFRGIPIWDPSWTVIELATGREHGPFDSEADVSLCLAFAKLARDQVEVLSDISPMATCTSW